MKHLGEILCIKENNMKTNFKYAFPSYRARSMGGGNLKLTVTSGEYAGKTFSSEKAFKDFFFKIMARERAEFEERVEQYDRDYRSELAKIRNRRRMGKM